MPGPLIRATDPALTASKLPQPLQWPVGAALGGLKSVFGDIPNPAMTTIGPGAIPLGDEAGYLQKVLGTTLGDLGSVYNRTKNVGFGAVKRNPGEVYEILAHAKTDPTLRLPLNAASELNTYPNHLAELARRHDDIDASGDNPLLNKIIQALADAYHAGMK